MIDIVEEKKRLRKIFKEKRNSLSAVEVKNRSHQICKNFINNLLPQIDSQKIFSLYLSSNNEVQTDEIAKYFNKKNIKFSYPKISQQNQPLDFILSEKNQILAANKFYPTILEPQNGHQTIPNYIILPLVAFDFQMSRLGMGGGFFDRTIEHLEQQKSKITTIGLAYDFQGLEHLLPIENSDQRLDFIVTEKNIFSKKLSLR